MVFITAEDYENAGVHIIKDNEQYFWIEMKDLEKWFRYKKYK